MANPEHLAILKQGVGTWNHWRKEYPEIRPDLSDANLKNTDLSRVDLNRARLNGADLSDTDLSGAILSGAILSGAILSGAEVEWTHFDHLDLSQVKGLETVHHTGPSHISIDTIYRSEGHIPEDFLRKAGVPETFIEYMRSLVIKPINYYTCFISYSSKDEAFAKCLYGDLQNKDVRCWFAPEDMKIGDKLRPRIDESIHLYDKLLLVFSQHSVASQWVEKEVEAALAKERKDGRTVLFPIRLDQAVMEIEGGWPALIRNTRAIGDFTRWKDHEAYQKGLKRLLYDLKAEP